MSRPITPTFSRFVEEGSIIGRLLIGYGELEFEWQICVGEALGGTQHDYQKALRTLFRIKSEGVRIEAGDALMRDYYGSIKLKDEYARALGAMRLCKKIRNQFAHCHWLDFPDEGLFFTNLHKAAESKEGEPMLPFRHVDLPLLKKHEAYFYYTISCLTYLSAESKRRREKSAAHSCIWPRELEPPPLHNPPQEHPLPTQMTSGSA